MARRDPFPRRTATVAGLRPWVGELASTLPGLIRSYGPRRPIDARTREQVMVAVTEVNGCRYCAFIHGEWRAFLGDHDVAVAEEVVLAHARASAEAGRPLDPAPLGEVLPPDAVTALRATVAQIEISNLVGNTLDGLLARLTRKRPLSPAAAGREALTVALAAPVALPLMGASAGMRWVNRVAPPPPEVDMPPPGRTNLLAHLLADAVPAYLANAAVRSVVLGLPFAVSIGVRAGRTTATVTVGRGAVRVRNGIARDAIAVVEGEVEPLLKLASGSVDRELVAIRLRPNQ